MSTPAITLPGRLLRQAELRPRAVALRHKRLGVWQARTWQQLLDEVRALATNLAAAGFAPGTHLLVLSRPRPEALIASLAAQWLGGVASLFDPLQEAAAQRLVLTRLGADFVLAEGAEEVARIRQAGLAPAWLVFVDGRGLVSDAHVRGNALDYAQLSIGEDKPAQPLSSAGDAAFAFYRHGAAGTERQAFSHAELLAQAEVLIRDERLTAAEEALAARAFAASGQARYLLASWLQAGFCLNFPERLETRDQDRRELGPSLVLGTRETYGRLLALLQERLPLAGTWRRRWLERVLAGKGGVLGNWLIRRPLRDVIGFSRARVALLVGAPLDEEARRFFDGLGIEVRTWPAQECWQVVGADDAPLSRPVVA
ncbi:AMP-binding protein [Pseudomonas sp. LRF_L74]|uniref:AMP-binding protein n=1 Tax=Pseudomonas sp. LRF_L74 TaxID=3369422 RepID=UPI003F6203E6